MSAKVVLLYAFSVQVLRDAVYSSVPEITVSKVEYDWLYFVFLEMVEYHFVVVVADIEIFEPFGLES